MRKPDAGGGWPAIRYTWEMGRRVGMLKLFRAMRSRNACKTCALGMGGQKGGMRNELGRFPELCKKSLQAMVADMQGKVSADFFKTYGLSQLESLSSRELEGMGRLVSPLYAAKGASHYEEIGWSKALELVADRMKAAHSDETFFYASGRSSNEAGFLLQLFARIYGTNNVNNCSYYCHQASGVGLSQAIGTGTATVSAEDIENSDLFFLIGGNPASNHPRLMTHLMHLKRRGGRVVVINPVKETGLVNFRVPSSVRSLLFGTPIADVYVQPKIGGDIALMLGMGKRLLERGAIDEAFIQASTSGWGELQMMIEATSWDDIEKNSGVQRQTIEKIGDMAADSRRTIYSWTMGITHHLHGVENVQWIVNLALMRGMIGRKHAGLLPIRGHSNVQGMGTVGVTPDLKPRARELWEKAGLSQPQVNGLDTMGCLEAAHEGSVRCAWALGGNLLGASPDTQFTREALSRVDCMIYLNTTLNTGHVLGRGRETLILPVLARDEEPFSTTQESMFSYVRLSAGGTGRHEGPRSEVEVLAEVAHLVLGDQGSVPWWRLRDAQEVRQWMARLVPDMEQSSEIDVTRKEFHIPGRILHDGVFAGDGRRARFFAHRIPQVEPRPKDQLTLMSIRSEGQFNTVVYEDYDLYRGQERRDVILMNHHDLQYFGLEENAPVKVKSAIGEMDGIIARSFEIKRGCALMYYPECNVLVPRTVDGVSKTPAYKSIAIQIEMSSQHGPDLGEPEKKLASPTKKLAPVKRPGGVRHAIRRGLRPKLNQC